MVWKLLVAILIRFGLLAISLATSAPERRPTLDGRERDLAVALPGRPGGHLLSQLLRLQEPGHRAAGRAQGPINALSFGWDMLAMVVFSLAICLLAVRQRLPREKVEEYIGDLTAEADPAVG